MSQLEVPDPSSPEFAAEAERQAKLLRGRPEEEDAIRFAEAVFADSMITQRSMRTDMDMLIRLVTHVDSTLDAIRADLKTLWLSQSDLRRRIEALEDEVK